MRPAENPFRSSRLESLSYRPIDWTSITKRLFSLGGKCSVVGPHGTGKTTFLLEFKTYLENQGYKVVYLFFNEEITWRKKLNQQFFLTLSKETILIIDGAEQISKFFWFFIARKLKKQKGVILSLHKQGRYPLLHATHASLQIFEQLVNELCAEPRFSNEFLAKLLSKHDGNMRMALFELYDVVRQDLKILYC